MVHHILHFRNETLGKIIKHTLNFLAVSHIVEYEVALSGYGEIIYFVGVVMGSLVYCLLPISWYVYLFDFLATTYIALKWINSKSLLAITYTKILH